MTLPFLMSIYSGMVQPFKMLHTLVFARPIQFHGRLIQDELLFQILEHKSDALSEFCPGFPGRAKVYPLDHYLSIRRFQQIVEMPRERGLPRAGLLDDPDPFPRSICRETSSRAFFSREVLR